MRLFGVCAVLCLGTALRRADHSSKESYRLCKNDYGAEYEAWARNELEAPLKKKEPSNMVHAICKGAQGALWTHYNYLLNKARARRPNSTRILEVHIQLEEIALSFLKDQSSARQECKCRLK
jgi:hypothetical protein